MEAGIKSGSLITAKYAKEQQRPVLAAPNSIYETSSAGTNRLIACGAEVYLSPEQLLLQSHVFCAEQGSETRARSAKQGSVSGALKGTTELTFSEKFILEQLDVPRAVEELAGNLQGNMAALLDLLCEMELDGKVEINQGLVKARRQ